MTSDAPTAAFWARHAQAKAELEQVTRRLADAQLEFIQSLVTANTSTVFGKEHGFDAIRDLDDFRKAVPIRDSAELAPWTERAAAGEPNVLTAEPVLAFYRTSGASGASKKIPVTASSAASHHKLRTESWGTPLLP